MTTTRQRQAQSAVAIARTATAEYDKVDFRALLRQVISLLEAAGIPMPRSGSVFLKPNVVIGATAADSVTTDPRFIAALVQLLREGGVRKVYVGDSSAGYLRACDTFRAAGMESAIRESEAAWVDIDDDSERVAIRLEGSDILESLTVPRKALEADCLVNFAKLKTHRVGSFTCCVKNWVGFLDKHVRLAFHQTRLPKLVAELHRALPEDLCFGDGVVIGEGDGPDLSRPRFLGALLASNDPVALDAIGAQMVGIHLHDLVFPWTAHLDGVGEIDRARIRLVGADPDSLRIAIEKPLEVMYHRFPCTMELGGVCPGCFAWFMGPALSWMRDGTWDRIMAAGRRPTVMMGFNATDVNFERHLAEGPYFVLGDCTPARFRTDPRVTFVPGCCPGPAIPGAILERCGIRPGNSGG